MPKSVAIYGLSVLFILSFFLFCFAQEQITITTYYPSPFGSYNQLRSNSLAVGSNAAMPGANATMRLGGAGTTPTIIFTNDATANNHASLNLNATRALIFSTNWNNSDAAPGFRFFDAGNNPATVQVGTIIFCRD